MRQKIFLFISLFIFVLFQIAFVPRFFPSGSAPNLVLILIVFLSSRIRLEQLWKYIIGAGILLDLFLFLPVGVHALIFLLVSIAAKVIERKFFIIHLTWRFFILVMLVALCTFMYEFLLPLFGRHVIEIEKELGFSLLYNAVFFAILYRPLRKIEDFFTLNSQKVKPKVHVG